MEPISDASMVNIFEAVNDSIKEIYANNAVQSGLQEIFGVSIS